METVQYDAEMDGPIKLPKLPKLTKHQQRVMDIASRRSVYAGDLLVGGERIRITSTTLDKLVDLGLLTRTNVGTPFATAYFVYRAKGVSL